MKPNKLADLPTFEAPGPQIVPELDTSAQRGGNRVVYDERSDEIARDSVSVNTEIARMGVNHPGIMPGFWRLTHPYFDMEVHRPTQNPVVVGNPASPVAATGRLFDASITTKRGTIDYIAAMDTTFMPAVIGMEAEIEAAKKRGDFSSYYPLLYRHTKGEDNVTREVPVKRDIYYVCTEQDGDLRVRSIIGGDAHTQDAMLQRGLVHDDGTISYDNGIFVDSLSYQPSELGRDSGDVNVKFEKAFSDFGATTNEHKQKLLMAFVMAMSAKIMNPDYDYVHDRTLDQKAKYYISQLLPGILRGEFTASNAVHPYLRGGALLRELALYEADNPLGRDGKRSIRLQRARILQSIVSAGAYLDIIGSSPRFDKEANDKRNMLGINTNTGTGLRFEAISLDETDRTISIQAKRALERMMAANNTSPHHKALRGVVEFLDAQPNDMLQIRPKGGNKIAPYSNTSAFGGPDAPRESALGYNGSGIAHGAWGHYPFEIPRSLLNPFISSGRFAEAGLAMGGVVAAFDVVTPESLAEKHGPNQVRCIVFSGKQMPWALQRALHERTHGQNRKLKDLRDAVDGSFGIIEELQRTRTQEWQIAHFSDKGVKMFPNVLTNGKAFAIGRDRKGVLYDDFGTIAGQKPRTRSLVQPRARSRTTSVPEPIYGKGTRAKADHPSVEPGQAVLEVRFVEGAVFVSGTDSTPDLDVDISLTPHFVKALPKTTRGRR